MLDMDLIVEAEGRLSARALPFLGAIAPKDALTM